ncbi:twin-arginine translocase TatA/TatE family subunit [Allosphingosinicella indica]|uniref:Sec-independent protein translocase protein TatA n=1 Tax=Allosphingosinicella indica TaxID=941907 RepID=A0A1X7FZU8_9SPHN|nr:twin-arginine translocase TatA/TatE family subunit [Allosphingosinicella indica]SMF61650.1 sec-independent protein translocase protein TatA [Allosphingosinicella indica]
MGGFSLWHWLIVGIIVLLLFGKGRFSDMMGDVAKGLKSFKKGMSDDDEPVVPPRRLEGGSSDVGRVDGAPLDPPVARPADPPVDRREP